MKYSTKELLVLWIDSIFGLSYKAKTSLIDYLDGKTEIYNELLKCKQELVENIGEKLFDCMLSRANGEYFNGLINEYNKKGIVPITYLSEDYPFRLAGLEDAPFVLYAKGNVKLLNDDYVLGIVGSRKTLPQSVNLAKGFAKGLADNGFTLITGIAEGIDETVIKESLSVNGKIISVICGGLDNIYPKANEKLVNEIIEKGGLVISEYPLGVETRAYMFPFRNRIIAGISNGVLVISGKRKSGTRYTAEYALTFGRDLFAIPYSIGIESGEICNELIKNGATLVESYTDVLEYYHLEAKEEKKIYTDQEMEIISALSNGELHIEKIAQKLNKTVNELTPIISLLEIKGGIYRAGFNIYGKN